ncbi:hypothetical protein J32TS6_06870 [Virgibacillus pantothenticus]|nr:hypothetical protein J32TS6_06870 [Virgibacillus pantothenticus]
MLTYSPIRIRADVAKKCVEILYVMHYAIITHGRQINLLFPPLKSILEIHKMKMHILKNGIEKDRR